MAEPLPAPLSPTPAIAVDFPVIERWAAGNTGTPYLWRFDSGKSGPHVAVQALTHGNEVCGGIALDFLLEQQVRPLRGTLSLCFANTAAFAAWNRDEPFMSRFVDEDFNRVWAPAVLDSDRDSAELRRARALRPFYDTLDYLLDIHSMSDTCPPLMLAGTRRKGTELALALGSPEYVVVDGGHSAGRRLRDYGAFDDPTDPRTALLIECGQHWTRASAAVAIQTALRFLRHFGMLDESFIAAHLAPASSLQRPQRVIEVTESVPIRTSTFTFMWPQDGSLAVVPKAGSLVARDGDTEVRTPYDNCALIMPMRRRSKPGDTAVRMGRFVS